MLDYAVFLDNKSQAARMDGFAPTFMPDCMMDFQAYLTDWNIRKGRCATFADCGLGKTLMELVFAQNVVEHTNRPALILAPLAVSHQIVREAEKFGIEARRSNDGKIWKGINITNYQRLHYFNSEDFAFVACDESGCLKDYDAKTTEAVTYFMRKCPNRFLSTATAAPNDYIELGTSSQALGELGYMDMLNRFFKNDNNNSSLKQFHGHTMKWRFKGHAEIPFWQWVSSWARAIRKPSDYGFDDGPFVLPPLNISETTVKCERPFDGELFVKPACGLREQREERKITLQARCEEAARKVNGHDRSVIWCEYNAEGDLLEKIVPDAVQISGGDSDERKEELLEAFLIGQVKRLVTKAKICGWGLNWQHCAHMTTFPSHSFEAFYQTLRRLYRFGQTRPVHCDIITTEGEIEVLKNLERKAEQAERMFDALIEHMNQAVRIDRQSDYNQKEVIPSWL